MPAQPRHATLALLLATCNPTSLAALTVNPSITLATYDYPPYCDSHDRDGGALVAIVKAAFDEEDIPVNLAVLPWQRLSSLSANGRFDGVIGVWKTDAPSLKIRPGPPVFRSVLGYYQRSDNPLSPGKLAGRQAGTVSGYHYPATVRHLGTNFDVARDDETNLRKLQQGRIDLAITEKAVGDALLRNGRLPPKPDLLWNGHVLGTEALSLGLYQGRLYPYWQQTFMRGLQKIQQNGRYHRIVSRYGLQAYAIPATARH